VGDIFGNRVGRLHHSPVGGVRLFIPIQIRSVAGATMNHRALAGFLVFAVCPIAWGQYNLKVVTDANPDYTDLPSLVDSATSRWETPEEKCRAMFYWNHIARRQTNPIILHGMAHTDPIRQF